MATATITRLSPTMPSQGSYDYLYQANVGLQNLHSVWAHAPRSDKNENRRTLKHGGKTSTAASCKPYPRPSGISVCDPWCSWICFDSIRCFQPLRCGTLCPPARVSSRMRSGEEIHSATRSVREPLPRAEFRYVPTNTTSSEPDSSR